MAQGDVSQKSAVGSNASPSLTKAEANELRQYEKIVRFRDTVLSGSHPTIKLPPGLKALAHPISSQTKISSESSVKIALPKNKQTSANATLESEPHALAGAPAPQSMPKSFGSGKTEINPILLEKSDELIRAELQLQRQRLERALKDEVEQRRVSKQAQAEPLLVFDLSDVLSKALTLVQATAIPLPSDEDLTANNEAASDSFDDNTFYSSQHDTPQSNLTSRIRNISEEAQVLNTSNSKQDSASHNDVTNRSHPASPIRGNRAADLSRPPFQNQHRSVANSTVTKPDRVLVPGLNNYNDGGDSSAGLGPTSGEPSQSEDSGMPDVELRAPHRGHDRYADIHPPSPLVRSHDLLPDAPQPVHTSPSAVVSEQAPVISSGVATAVGTPAQVAALRTETVVAMSSDSSSQGGRDAEKKKGKKKKRKADRQAPEAEVGTYIKPEPRSPSPLTAPSYIRPNKRQRQIQGQVSEPGHAEPGYARPPANVLYEQNPPQVYREERVPIGYEGPVLYPQRAASTAVLGDPRYGREYVDERQVSGDVYMRRPPSPGAPPYQYSFREAHPTRAVSQVIVNDPYREPPRIYREPLEGPRMSARPEGEAFMAPPRPPPTRIVVDAFGREYIEPHPSSARQSVAPSARPGDPEIIYERVQPRAMSGHPGAGPYDDGTVVYARPPAAYAMSRRYVTQPEYVPQDYRDSQHREYSSQPTGAGGFVQVIAPQDRRHLDERPREYVARAASLRPPEPVRFEAPPTYGRMHSVRPEAPGREYGGSMHPENRHAEGPQTYAGEYSSGPIQQPYVHQEYNVRPAERYHEPQGVMRGADEIAFIERPRGATQEIVYVDDARREVYR